ncbi:MAG: DUF4298 domain-containing protein [Muribaculaceae bacterium]|nr:DUF4298 domain-containing protein [Muribaculaceae bacterium]
MEANLDEAYQAILELSVAIEKYAEAKPAVHELSEYLGSEDWFNDRDADDAGSLPADLKRGVLSEDGIWNVLEDSRQLNIRLLEVATDFLKDN